MKSLNTNLVLLAATTLLVAACSSSNKSPSMGPPGAANLPPTISFVADHEGDQDFTIGPIPFGVTDTKTDAAALKVTASADSAAVFPADGVVLSGSGVTRSITLTPLEAATGTATISLLVTDAAGASTTRDFKVMVNAKSASVRDVSVNTFAKGETDAATVVNGFTFTQDADDAVIFDPLIASQP